MPNITVSTTATLLFAAKNAVQRNWLLAEVAAGGSTVYVGPSPSVTVATGHALTPNSAVACSMFASGVPATSAWYGIVASGTQVVKTSEGGTGTTTRSGESLINIFRPGSGPQGPQGEPGEPGESGNNYTHPNHSGDVTSVGDGEQTIANDAVTNAKLANMSSATLKGRAAAGTGDPADLTASEVRTLLNVADGANNYTLPVAGTSAIGGVKRNLPNDTWGIVTGIDSSGNLVYSALIYPSNGTTGLNISGDEIVLGSSGPISINGAQIGLFTATPISQPTSSITDTCAATGGSTSQIYDDTTFGGYTIGQVVTALKALGALA